MCQAAHTRALPSSPTGRRGGVDVPRCPSLSRRPESELHEVARSSKNRYTLCRSDWQGKALTRSSLRLCPQIRNKCRRFSTSTPSRTTRFTARSSRARRPSARRWWERYRQQKERKLAMALGAVPPPVPVPIPDIPRMMLGKAAAVPVKETFGLTSSLREANIQGLSSELRDYLVTPATSRSGPTTRRACRAFTAARCTRRAPTAPTTQRAAAERGGDAFFLSMS